MTNTQTDDLLVFNGLDAISGGYLAEPVTLEALRDRAFQAQQKGINLWEADQHLDDLRARNTKVEDASFDLNRDIAPEKLAEAGWGIIFPEAASKDQVEKIQEALSDLIKLRSGQAGELFHIYYGNGDGYRARETGEEFSARHGVGFGSVDPQVMPFYLLIVADPISIPFSFQYQLDVQFAVGRIYFETLDEYAQYARSVRTAELEPAQVKLARKAVFFGTANPNDPPTGLSTRMLIDPLAEYVNDEKGSCKTLGWTEERVPADQACKPELLEHLGGAKTPALLFTASHGLSWPNGDAGQLPFQGSLVCQEWPGPKEWPTGTKLPRDFYVGAEDIAADASLLGTVAFLFACYGAGTPHLDDYAVARNLAREPLAARPFLAALPRRLLSHPRGGALAVVGHVERAWAYSFNWKVEDAKPESFKNFLYEMMSGKPVGYAMESLNNRYGQVATAFSREIERKLSRDPNYDAYTISQLWMTNNDARAYAIIGDPAVRIPQQAKGAAEEEVQRPLLAEMKLREGTLPAILVTNATDENGRPFVTQPVVKTDTAMGVQGTGDSGAGDGSGAGGGADSGENGAGATKMGQVDQGVNAPVGQQARGRSPMDGLAMALEAYQTDPVSFGIKENIQEKIGPVVQNLFAALQATADKLQQAANQAATLEISTSVVDNLNTFDPLNPAAGPVDKRFLTTVSLTGDTQLFLSSQIDSSDDVLLTLHKEMVAQAHANRMEMIKTLSEMIASLFGGGK